MSKLKKEFKMNLSRRIFFGWIMTLFIPMLLFALTLFIQYGDNIINMFNSDFDIWQRHGFMSVERISRDINNWILDDPIFGDHEALNNLIRTRIDPEHFQTIIIERKGQDISTFITYDESLIEDVREKFSTLDSSVLPAFGADDVTTNHIILEKTGYVLFRQTDFYYADGHEGSIFYLLKYTNIPFTVMKVIGDNLLIVIVVMMIINALASYVMIRKMTKPYNDMLRVMKSYKQNDFKPRLDEDPKRKMLYTINSAVNDMASALDQAQENSIELERQREEFIAKISHDTKTPLASIRAHTEAIRDGLIKDEKKRLKYTGNILKKVQALDHMINELSLYSELEVGLNQYTFSKVNLGYYIEDILEELQYDLDKTKVTLNYENQLTEEIFMYLDVNRFQRVMINLINNSVRYGQREQLKIDVTVKSHEGFAKIYVRDNGVGLTIDDPHVLLTSFVRGEASRDPNNSGSGLGLAIAKSIINKHEGDITINTEAGVYFEVCMTLPLEGGYFEENIDN